MRIPALTSAKSARSMTRNSKFIVLTGVTRGLGRALLEGFIAEGHTVAGCGRSAKAIDELRQMFPAPHRFDTIDVTNDDAVKTWAAAVLADHHAPDLLINNAALINRAAPLWEITPEEFNEVIAVNINGVANVIRHF